MHCGMKGNHTECTEHTSNIMHSETEGHHGYTIGHTLFDIHASNINEDALWEEGEPY